jgi:hypothetical protein
VPLSLTQKIHVVVPASAQFEKGFIGWVQKIKNLSSELKKSVCFYTTTEVFDKIQTILKALSHNQTLEHYLLKNMDDFLILTQFVKTNDLLVFISARRQSISYQRSLEKIPNWLSSYFDSRNVVVLYPEQNPIIEINQRRMDGSLNELIEENVERIERVVKGIKKVFKA